MLVGQAERPATSIGGTSTTSSLRACARTNWHFACKRRRRRLVDIFKGSRSRPCADSTGSIRKHTREFGTRCLLARRMIEGGVRFVQLYSGNTTGWDAHKDVLKNHTHYCGATDLPVAGLLRDLKARGLLEDTLVIWGGEFGRPDNWIYIHSPDDVKVGRGSRTSRTGAPKWCRTSGTNRPGPGVLRPGGDDSLERSDDEDLIALGTRECAALGLIDSERQSAGWNRGARAEGLSRLRQRLSGESRASSADGWRDSTNLAAASAATASTATTIKTTRCSLRCSRYRTSPGPVARHLERERRGETITNRSRSAETADDLPSGRRRRSCGSLRGLWKSASKNLLRQRLRSLRPELALGVAVGSVLRHVGLFAATAALLLRWEASVVGPNLSLLSNYLLRLPAFRGRAPWIGLMPREPSARLRIRQPPRAIRSIAVVRMAGTPTASRDRTCSRGTDVLEIGESDRERQRAACCIRARHGAPARLRSWRTTFANRRRYRIVPGDGVASGPRAALRSVEHLRPSGRVLSRDTRVTWVGAFVGFGYGALGPAPSMGWLRSPGSTTASRIAEIQAVAHGPGAPFLSVVDPHLRPPETPLRMPGCARAPGPCRRTASK